MEDFNIILTKYKRYILSLAYSYGQNDSDIIKDLEQEGMIGLYEAFKKYDPSLNVPFLGYAKMYIKGHQLNYLNNNARTIRLPQNKILAEMKGEFISTTNTTSIDKKTNYDSSMYIDTGTMKDVLAADDIQVPIDMSVLHKAFNRVKLRNKERDIDIILMNFGLEPYDKSYSFHEIAIKYDLSRERIRQVFDKTMDKLRKNDEFKLILKQLVS